MPDHKHEYRVYGTEGGLVICRICDHAPSPEHLMNLAQSAENDRWRKKQKREALR